jgi:hypothetical protein
MGVAAPVGKHLYHAASGSMFVFSRRAIQRCLDGLNDVLSSDQRNGLAKRLNRVGPGRFAASWEACLLYAFSRLGAVSHEVPLPNGSKPDISFRYPGEKALGFIADVTAISDEGRHNANPVQDFAEQLARIARNVGLDPDHIRYSVRGRNSGTYGYQKTTLLLPPQGEITDFLSTRVLPFLERIRDQQSSEDHLSIESDEVSVTISYAISQRFMTGGYPAYDIARSPKKNPLWNKLVDKASKLEAGASIAPIGIIACDAGCSLFNRSASFDTFTVTDIARQFFKEHPLISFVLLLSIREIDPLTRGKRRFRIEPVFYPPRKGSTTLRLQNTMLDAVTKLPKPVLSTLNAYMQCRRPGYTLGHLGGYQLSRSFVKISARCVLEMLAGRMTASDFNEAHGWLPGPGSGTGVANPFEGCLQQGRMITRIRVDADEDDSDDWITIEFGEPDPAISPFVVKPKSDTKK